MRGMLPSGASNYSTKGAANHLAHLSGDLDVKVYIDQTIPVLETHLKIPGSLRHDDKVLGSAENPANNKAAN
jgi:hypothetical protein